MDGFIVIPKIITTRLHISPFRACGDMGQSPIIFTRNLSLKKKALPKIKLFSKKF